VRAGEAVRFQLSSGDVVHGFAIGRMNARPVLVRPGAATQFDATFDQPGRYTFYCTEWCSVAHWRMRGVIEVVGTSAATRSEPAAPDYARLGIDIDAPRPAPVPPASRPSASRGAQWQSRVPDTMRTRTFYISRSPAQAWQALRDLPAFQGVDDQAVWDAVAWLWQAQASAQAEQQGAQLYARNCAACHGVAGAGDGPSAGVMAGGHMNPTTDFTDAKNMLSASPALLDGKVIRGGMGTGMPSWGAIFTDDERRAVVDYLWRFQFDP
jgi:mono/diheme cytochrome c family protein